MQKSKVECLIEAFYLCGRRILIFMSQETEGRDIEIESFFFRTVLDIHNHDTWKLEEVYLPTLRDWHV